MPRIPSAALAAALATLPGCTSYTPAPRPPLEVLAELERVGLAAVASDRLPGHPAVDPADGLTAVEAATAAVRLNPRLQALRAEVGVSGAQLVEAGLLPDIRLGWDAMDAAAGLIVNGEAESPAWLAGADLSWPVPRPGEIDAREGVARAGLAAARARVLAAEWALVRDVHLAYVRLVAARARVAQVERLAAIAQRSLDYFRRARGLGAATALDENLAAVAASGLEAGAVRAAAGARQAAQALNALLGLRPDAELVLQSGFDALAPADLGGDADALVARALARRPDVREVEAAYQRAEERLRLEAAQQWPQLSIGTGIGVTLPIFSRFNQPAVRTAERAREAAGRRLTITVQAVRRDVHAALVERRQAERLLAVYRERVEPGLTESLRLTEQAFQAREVTPLQILTTQRQVVAARGRALEAQERLAAARVRLAAAAGVLLPELRTPYPAAGEPQ